ncbi:GNAT family N-acetyltransferase [Solitalea canadensis]|uniref:Sortase-like acyltransferase n=1 Tax=Solitalea canadensis (strain ATCC 29591 / DSM 3403 / JCM 21819 / LMG 8368 / NBRC 15130 / NCIMB 12057 / USAM 9D) TaxID=929556 RepID=H8KLD7_SOLCM|nr:GNAT family N-acetyltransferase [Solitalea canadensis]AFD08639.1 sortase-like acyltransferase [Solitalea canadensis DSM 3403]
MSKILNMLPIHWNAVKTIYEAGIATGNATFQQAAPSWEEWDADHLLTCRFVVEEDGKILGWAALSKVSGRCVYAGVAEVSVYVSPAAQGKGIGLLLLNELINKSEQNGLWTLQAGIFPENIASVRLHEKAGFRQVGYRERIGKMNGIWRSTLLLERRSSIIAQD